MRDEDRNALLIEMGSAEDLILGKSGIGPDEEAFNVLSDDDE